MSVRIPAFALALTGLLAACGPAPEATRTSRPAPAAAAPADGACTQHGLTGLWSLESVTAAEKGVQDFYAQHPVEYLRFTADGKYDYVAMNTPLADAAAITASLDRADAGDGVTYAARMLGGGMLMIYRDGAPWQGFMCATESGKMVWTEMQSYPAVRRVQVRVG